MIPWLARRADVSAGRCGTARTQWPARRQCGTVGRTAARRLLPKASFPGIRRANRCCGGRPTRAWCSLRRVQGLALAAERPCVAARASPHVEVVHRPRVQRRDAGLLRHRAPMASAPGSRRRSCSAYGALHARGLAHSVETWVDGALAGGLYGVSLGRMFFGESMFARARTPRRLRSPRWYESCCDEGVPMIDCQQNTRHLASLGGREITRHEFTAHVRQAVRQPPIAWANYRRRLNDDAGDCLRARGELTWRISRNSRSRRCSSTRRRPTRAATSTIVRRARRSPHRPT